MAFSTPEFIEVHASDPPHITPQIIRPGTAIGRPQTSIGRPGTAVARPAPPKVKKNIISSNLDAQNYEKTTSAAAPQNHFILADNKDDDKEDFLVEDDDEQLLNGSMEPGANVSKLQEGDDHGILVNKIIENTRDLEKEHHQVVRF